MVVIAGKGHEQGQEFEDGRKIPFDDVDRRARSCCAPPCGVPTAPCRLAVRAMQSMRMDARAGRRGGRRAADRRAGGRSAARARDDRLARGGPGALFVGLPGEHARRRRVRAAGARGRGVGGADDARARASALERQPRRRASCSPPTIRSRALQRLATAWRRELGAPT